MTAYIKGDTTRNVLTAVQQQNAFYQRVGKQGQLSGYNQFSNQLLPQTLLSVTGTTRNLNFDIPTPNGSTPGPAGLAGSPTLGVLVKAPNITPITTAGTQ